MVHHLQLKQIKLQEIFCTDTVLASVTLLEGYNSANAISGNYSGYNPFLLRKESKTSQELEDFIRNVGAPYHIQGESARW